MSDPELEQRNLLIGSNRTLLEKRRSKEDGGLRAEPGFARRERWHTCGRESGEGGGTRGNHGFPREKDRPVRPLRHPAVATE